MVTWALILTLAWPGSPRRVTMTTLPGFASAQQCTEAGRTWQRQLDRGEQGPLAFAVCVKQGAPDVR